MTTQTPDQHLMLDIALSDCTYLKNFTRRDEEEFWGDCIPSAGFNPLIAVGTEQSLPDGSFTWTEDVTNQVGSLNNVVNVVRIPTLPPTAIASFTRDGVDIPVTDDGSGGAELIDPDSFRIGPNFSERSICILSFTASAVAGPYPATVTLHSQAEDGDVLTSDDFVVLVSSAALGPLILSIEPSHGTANGGTAVIVHGINLDQVAGLGVNPVVDVGGTLLLNTSVGPNGEDIYGTTGPMLSGQRDATYAEIRPTIDPFIRHDTAWRWDIVDWDETTALGKWGSIPPGVDWVEGMLIKTGPRRGG